MATPALRPLSIGEILDAGIKVVLRNWKVLMGCTAALMAPLAVVLVLLLASIDPEQLELIPEQNSSDPQLPDASVWVGLGVVYVIGLIALLVSYGSCFKAVSDAWLGRRPAIGESLRYGLNRAPAVFLLGLVWFLFVLVAWIPCCIPLIWLGVAWCLSLPALLFERIGPLKAFSRSYGLVQNRWWATFLLAIICYFLTTIISTLVQLPLLLVTEIVAGENAIASGLAQGLAYTISFAITFPYYAAVLTILYFDQRVRKEGFDLQLMAQGLGVEPDLTATLPIPAGPMYTPEQRAAAPYWPPPPGWQPPPPGGWSSPSGWSAPSPEPPSPPLWGSGPPPPPADSPWMTPPSGEPPPGGWAPPAQPQERSPWAGRPTPGEESPTAEPPEAEPAQEDDEKRKRDPDRADWLPPEEPRGPEGL